VVEGAPLLREYTGNGIEGSNPFLSAISAQFPALPTSSLMQAYGGSCRTKREFVDGPGGNLGEALPGLFFIH
jgi:hypothetical protein